MSRFDYFVVFAEMRTGSNFLEANLNLFDGLTCHGEAFNAAFIGYPNKDNILGVSQPERDAKPLHLLETIKTKTDGMGGFRYFNDHDPRVFNTILNDPRCAKIILTRNPVDSFVSWKIAQATGQWKLTNVKNARSQQITFDLAEFEAHLEGLQAFQVRLLNGLQKTGQTAFYVAYEDLQDVDIMNGIAMFLGTDARITALDKQLKKQNPAPMQDKVTNFADMELSLARLDRFNLSRTPNFEPRRGPNTPSFVAAVDSPLLYLPIKSGPEDVTRNWLAQLDGKTADMLRTGMNQNALRDWLDDTPGHRSFTVIRHPVARAHAAFCDKILAMRKDSFPEIRQTLRKVHKLPIPDYAPEPETDSRYGIADHRTAFLSFLGFLKNNLSAQTAVRVDPAWASQLAVMQGFAGFGLPDLIVREDRMQQDLAILASQIGHETMPGIPAGTDPHADRLAQICDAEIEAAARAAYARDYTAFGFGDYQP
ncbi:sulfotransferase family 2 domain-containing protein [Yoonia sp. 208BN28-4]|uniref:sulfotransferase family 2 domain-containing protein n=1 Tax=Yoonia sp. 208BN28-4 TaxID=3126505 RepID=UPI0030A9B7B4